MRWALSSFAYRRIEKSMHQSYFKHFHVINFAFRSIKMISEPELKASRYHWSLKKSILIPKKDVRIEWLQNWWGLVADKILANAGIQGSWNRCASGQHRSERDGQRKLSSNFMKSQEEDNTKKDEWNSPQKRNSPTKMSMHQSSLLNVKGDITWVSASRKDTSLLQSKLSTQSTYW